MPLSNHRRFFLVTLLASAALAAPRSADAGAPAPSLARLLQSRARPSRPHPLADARGRVAISAQLPKGAPAEAFGLLPAAPGVGVIHLEPSAIDAFAAAHPELSLHASPPMRPLLDYAVKWTRADAFHVETGGEGAGVVVGIIDTGLDVAHPDFRNPDGSTRVAWMLTLEDPRGVHKELEARFGCDDPKQQPCAIYSAADIDAILASGLPHSLHDYEGHGTHVTSIAAGNGGVMSLKDPPTFVGVAPKSTLVVVTASKPDGGFGDTDTLNAARFVFDRADELQMPAVANISVGGDFGAHDGTSDLEKGLAAFIGDDKPGRAIVTAAGNSGALYSFKDKPDPYGIHTEVHVSPYSDVRVPIWGPSAKNGRGYVWITFRPGDEVSVGLDGPDGETWVRLTEPGSDRGYDGDKVTAGVINNIVNGKAPLTEDTNGAVVAWDGEWGEQGKASELAIRMSGHGDAQLWMTALGDVSPASSVGLFFEKGMKQGTITVPASSPSLLAVGCMINRLSWPTAGGMQLTISGIEGITDLTEDSQCYFSSAGPTPFGVPKPEISAPGGFVIGAMSADADPRSAPGGLFDAPGCPEGQTGCYVVDDRHAVTAGTSMSAPQVAGAIALLFEQSPTLTQAAVTDVLQAGARRPVGKTQYDSQLGAGELDIMGALAALPAVEAASAEPVDVTKSWYVLSSAYARPDPTWPVWGTIELRRADGSVASGLDGTLLEVHVDGGVVTQPLAKVRHGLFRFAVAGAKGSGGSAMTINVTYNGASLGARELLIGRDLWSAKGEIGALGGCSSSPSSSGGAAGAFGSLALAALFALRRARQHKVSPRRRV